MIDKSYEPLKKRGISIKQGLKGRHTGTALNATHGLGGQPFPPIRYAAIRPASCLDHACFRTDALTELVSDRVTLAPNAIVFISI